MRDLRSAGVTSRGQAKPAEDRVSAGPGGAETSGVILSLLVTGVRGAVNAVGYFQNYECQFEQNSRHQNTNE